MNSCNCCHRWQAWLEKHLKQLGLLDFFTVRTYSCEFDSRKPDAGIFRIDAERIGEAAENIMYVGDRIDKNIIPTLKIGMTPVLKAAYTNAGKTIPNGAWKIDQISELPALIKKINTKKEPKKQFLEPIPVGHFLACVAASSAAWGWPHTA